MKQITVLSLFDGISCARVALDRLGYTDVLYLASEVDKYASAITRYQWPDTIHLGDITQIKRENLPVQIDLLIGGSPCQDLSIAKNNRKGLDGERSGLFWEWVRLWQECKPTWWVLENVNSMPKEAKRIISETLGVEPIMINAALVSAQNRKRLFWTNIESDIFGNCHIPQPEDRGILLKHILETGQGIADKSYTIDQNYWRTPGAGKAGPGGSQAARRKQVIEDKSHPINATYWKAGTSEAAQEYSDRTHQRTLVAEPAENSDKPIRVGDIGSDAQAHRVYSQDGKSVTLSAMGGGQGAKTGLYAIPEARGVALRSRTRHDNHAHEKYEKRPEITGEKANAMTSVQTDSMVAIPEATKQGYAIAEEGDSIDLSYPNSKTRRGRVSKKAPSQMTSSQSVGVLEGYTIRKLTLVECERLMTLPDQYTALGDFGDGEPKPISNTQRYKTLGNGFVVEVVAHILSFMEES
jgi:DNA (cytosine-5)-methyltransferase 3A